MIKLRTTLFFVLCLFPVASYAELREVPFISVMAASSMTLPLTELSRLYSAYANVTVNVVYDSSIELASQLEKGEHTDVFISAGAFPIAMLKRKNLLDTHSTTDIAYNKLALVASLEHPFAKHPPKGSALQQLLATVNTRTMLVIGDPDTTPLGAYTYSMMQNVGVWDRAKSMTIRADNARIALYLIAKGKNAGITYYSDAHSSKEVTIISALPKKLYPPIIYKAAILEGGDKLLAKEFVEFLTSKQAKEVLTRYGFEVK